MITKEQLHPNDQTNWPGFVSYICGKWEISRRYQPKTILEIGVRAGYAARAFLNAHPTARYIGIDNYSYGAYPDWAIENILRDRKFYKPINLGSLLVGFSNNDLLYNADTQKIKSLSPIMADFIHIDGDHSIVGVIHDLDLALSALNTDGVILIDDYDRIPDVKTGVNLWLADHPDLKWKYCETFTGDILIGNISDCIPEISNNETQKLPSTPEQTQGTELLVFHHGLGDLLMFLPLYEHLQKIGNYQLALQEGCNFTPLAPGSIETPTGSVDYNKFCKEKGFSSYKIVQYLMSEGTGKTKSQLCAEIEFGIYDFSISLTAFRENPKHRKVIGINFFGTCLPNQTNPDEATAKRIWAEIKEAGYVPLEIYFEHTWHNPSNEKYEWIDNSIRGAEANIYSLKTILQGCIGFIGVASGPWVAAMKYCQKTENVFCLTREYSPLDYFYNEGIGPINTINSIDINSYIPGSVKKCISMLS